jgi:hypothetical protein
MKRRKVPVGTAVWSDRVVAPVATHSQFGARLARALRGIRPCGPCGPNQWWYALVPSAVGDIVVWARPG